MAFDGPALLAAAVRAACLAKAPRRTVQAVAAAVTGVLARPSTAAAEQATATGMPARSQRAATHEQDAAPSPEELQNSLRAVRTAQRRRKKERRRAAKEAAKEEYEEEVQTPVLVKPGLRGDQDKPASEVGEAKVDGAEKEEERRRGQELEDVKKKETEEQGEGQPPPKQVRVHENVDMDRIQSEGAASRSSQHSSTMTRLATLPGYDRQRQFLEQRREQQGRQITDEDIRRAIAATNAQPDMVLVPRRATQPQPEQQPWRVRSRSKARKKK